MSILLPSTSIVMLTSLILFLLILVALFLTLQTSSLYLRVYTLLSHHLSLTPYSRVNRKSWDLQERFNLRNSVTPDGPVDIPL